MAWLNVGIAVLALVASNALATAQQPSEGQPLPEMSDEERAIETQSLMRGYRAAPLFRTDDYFGQIGALVKNGHWTKVLPLADAQADAIKQLDQLVWDARVQTMYADADYMATNPEDYKEYAERHNARRVEAIRHGQRMVNLGLLSDAQAAFVNQRIMSSRRTTYALSAKNVQDLLGVTDSQRAKLRVSPSVKHALEVLTPGQHRTFTQLRAEVKLPGDPPELSPADPPGEDLVNRELFDRSPVFRVIDEQADRLKLSDEQQRLLKELKEVTWLGLKWIGQMRETGPWPEGDPRNDPADPVGQTQAEFLKHAEQLALVGILSEEQTAVVDANLLEHSTP